MTELSNSVWRDQIDKEMHGLTSQVSSLTHAVGELTAYQRTQGERFDRMADAMEADRQKSSEHEWDTPRVISVVGASLVGVAVTVGGLFYGIAGYVDMRNATTLSALDSLSPWMLDKDAFQRQVHYENGIATKDREFHDEEILRLWARINDMRETIGTLREDNSAAQVSRRAMGEYVKEHVADKGLHEDEHLP